jgi:ferric-dicitrate binding protein FerR (iron transport regulator)
MEYERDPRLGELADRETPPPAEWLRLTRYLLGELDAEGCAEVEQWVAQKPVRAPVVALLRQAWRMPVRQEPPVDSTAALARVIGQIGQGLAMTDSAANHPSLSGGVSAREQSARPALKGIGGLRTQPLRRGVFKAQPLRRWLWSTSAVLLVGVVGAIVGWRVGMPHVGPAETTSMLTYVTGNGERANIILPDGSTVALNVASRLDVPVDYGTGDHTVRLVGQALFKVSHHETHPLTIRTASAFTRVLGTSFMVRQYHIDTMTTVAVREGKVEVGPVVLAANQQVEIGQHLVSMVQSADPAGFTFATGVLTIDGRSLADAIPDLDRWYDADIRLGDTALANRRIMGEFRAGSLSDLSDVLGLSGVRVKRVGRVLTLYTRSALSGYKLKNDNWLADSASRTAP